MKRWMLLLFLLLPGCLEGPLLPSLGGDRGPGSLASDYVTSKKYSRLVIELHAPSGAGPLPSSLSDFVSVVQSSIDKVSVEVQTYEDVPSGGGKKYTMEEIQQIESKVRKGHSSGNTAVLFLLYLDGGSSADTGDASVLGVAYSGSSFAVFKENIRAVSRGGILGVGAPQERYVERAVLVHEFGHLLGLVNMGTPMVQPHEDPDHPSHSSNRKSVMYWAVESSAGLLSILSPGGSGSDIPYTFDSMDMADLNALKGR